MWFAATKFTSRAERRVLSATSAPDEELREGTTSDTVLAAYSEPAAFGREHCWRFRSATAL
jgi:hypothetical protein